MNVPLRFFAAALVAATLAAGCGSSSSGPAFKTQSGLQINAASQACLVHQSGKPTKDYQGGSGATTSDVLTFLAYYTANGNKKFCDGKAANANDKAWAALYITLDSSAAAKNVKGITG